MCISHSIIIVEVHITVFSFYKHDVFSAKPKKVLKNENEFMLTMLKETKLTPPTFPKLNI